ncbi:MAG: biopolymer transporter ExbD [Bacteroidales bacterium]|nr:biopolymer transporter ExbD [Bacteroidales bacterium]MBR4177467.1 biopolymer transporter ExbD [Bacteroidales bacterium]
MTMSKKSTPGLNTSSMSDISFLLLAFFLMVSNINTDMGIARRLPPPLPPDFTPPEVRERNIFQVKINRNDRILFNKEVGDISLLKDRAKEFLGNPQDRDDLPQKEVINIPLLGNYPVSKGVISLQNDRGTSYDTYFRVQNELTAAINEMRDELSREKFNRPYKDLDQDHKDAIDKAIPVAISEAEPKNTGGTK